MRAEMRTQSKPSIHHCMALYYKFFRVKKGKLQKLIDWARYLSSVERDVIDTLNEEGVAEELIRIIHIDDSDYALALQEVVISARRPADMGKELNRRHRETLEDCLEEIESEELYRFSANIPSVED